MANKLFGAVCIFFGANILLWVAYNLLIERLPATEGQNPLPAIVFSLCALIVGVSKFKKEDSDDNSKTPDNRRDED